MGYQCKWGTSVVFLDRMSAAETDEGCVTNNMVQDERLRVMGTVGDVKEHLSSGTEDADA